MASRPQFHIDIGARAGGTGGAVRDGGADRRFAPPSRGWRAVIIRGGTGRRSIVAWHQRMHSERSSRNSKKSGAFRIRSARWRSAREKITPTICGLMSDRTNLAIEACARHTSREVELEVQQIAALRRRQIGLRSGVRNDPDRKTFRPDFGDVRLIPFTAMDPLKAT